MKTPTRPERWVVVTLSIKNEEPFQKVLAGWYGGYLGSDEWRFSSKIETIVDCGDEIEFHNLSGSTYICHKGGYGISMLMWSIFEYYKQQIESLGGTLEIDETYNPNTGEDNGEGKTCNKEGEGSVGDSEAKESQEGDSATL